MEKRAQRVDELLERSMDSVTSHPAFLQAVSTLLNVNSYRKIWFRKSMEALWKDLELPIRRDQEILLNQIEELNLRIKKLELELQQERAQKSKKAAATAKSGHLKSKVTDIELEFQ